MNLADSLTITADTNCEIVVTRQFNAPRELVFEAYTNPEYVPRWMLGPEGWTMPVCEIDLRPGGAWHFVWRMANGSEMVMRGVYREVTPPSRLVSTESWGGDWPETVNTLELSEENGLTTMQVTILYPSNEARDAALRTGIREGMGMSYARLEKTLATLKRPG
jgi:uncharacterized protein YndB with AHSA1/START domain